VAKEVSKDWNQSDSNMHSLVPTGSRSPLIIRCVWAFNVYDNKYRINVYTHEVINDIESQRISQLDFAKLAQCDGSSLEILLKPAPVDPKKKK